MKRFIYLGLVLITGLSFNTFAQESDSTGMPGDHFDLEGALNLFKESKSPEDFEKKLNTESSKVNNLDLNGDNKIDYIRVVDKKEGNSHAILLQIPVNKTEIQDVAAIVIEKRSDSEAQLQIIGDETLYGEETIMEPIDEKEVKKSSGPATLSTPVIVFVNVWYWPCVQYIYDPFYDPWFSPYYWDYYPSWWYPWRPVYWHVYYQRMYFYHGWCQYTTVYHVPNAYAVYGRYKSNSPTVINRYASQQAAYKARSLNNQSAGNPGRRSEPAKSTQPIKRTAEPKEAARPSTNREPKTLKRSETVPRPINSNNRGNVTNGDVRKNNKENIRTVEPSRRNPTTAPQQRPVERSPRQVNPQPRRQTQPIKQAPQQRQVQPQRQTPQNRPVVRPSNGGGRIRGRG